MAVYELEVYKRVEELTYQIYARLVNFPKSEKFALCQDIKHTFYEILAHISLGNSVKSKRKVYLQEADGYLQVLKVLMKLSYRRKYITLAYYQQIDEELTNINKMLSAYIRVSA